MTKVTPHNTENPTATEAEMPVMEAEIKNGAENGAENKSIKTPENEETVEAPGSQPIAYYLKYKINEKLIKGLVNNNRFNNSRSGTRVGTKKGKEYKVLLGGPVYDVILKKKIKKKEDIRGNFKIPCSAGDLKHVNALVYQGSDDVLVDVAEYVYPIDFVILDIKENEKRPFILGTQFLTTAKSSIKFDKGTITLRSGKSKASLGMGRKDKLHLEREMKFNQWRSKNFKGKHPTLIATKEGMDDEGEVTLYLMRRSLEVFRKFHWMILGGRFNQLSHVSSPLLSKPGEY
ncbi:zinc finger, CCHC-type containing protein [Tanacetum coccineum]